jgi:hypothetical protein
MMDEWHGLTIASLVTNIYLLFTCILPGPAHDAFSILLRTHACVRACMYAGVDWRKQYCTQAVNGMPRVVQSEYERLLDVAC